MHNQLMLFVQRWKRISWQCGIGIYACLTMHAEAASWIIHTKSVASDGLHASPSSHSLSYSDQGKRVARQLAQKTGQTIGWIQSINADTHVVNIENEQTVSKLKADSTIEWMEPNTRRRATPLLSKVIRVAGTENASFVYEPAVLSGITDPRNTGTDLWNLDNVDVGGGRFNQAWGRSTGQDVVVAVVDSGAVTHEDLGNINLLTGAWVSAGYTFITDCRVSGTCAFDSSQRASYTPPVAGAYDLGDGFSQAEKDRADTDLRDDPTCVPDINSWHGTFVSSIIAARKNNVGGVGAAYNARILPVRVLGKCGGQLSDIALGIRWAAGLAVQGVPTNLNPARIIVLSLDASGSCTRTEQESIDAVVQAGAVVIVAAGNGDANGAPQNLSVNAVTPATCKNVVAVTAHGRSGQHASYANYGSMIALSAPGGIEEIAGFTVGGIWGAVKSSDGITDTYAAGVGTSFAAPHVAATVALMLKYQPALKVSEIHWALKQSTRTFPAGDSCASTGAYAGLCGAGLLDAGRALDKAAEAISLRVTTPIPDDFVATDYTVKPSTGGCTLGYGNDHALVMAVLLGLIGVLRAYYRRNVLSN